MNLAELAFAVLMAVASVTSVPAFASEPVVESMDTDTHSVVIDKLEMSLSKAKDSETISLAPVRARLADLYSDRARLQEMQEQKDGAKPAGSRKDRERALQLYALVLKESEKSERGPIMIHMSHLDLLLNRAPAATVIYEQIIKEGPSNHVPSILQQAYAGRAENFYQHGKFKEARNDFEVALRFAPTVKRGPLAHRIAWCNLNLDEQETAVAQLVAILRNPEMLKRESTEGSSVDLAFEDEVANDLATFVARGNVTSSQIALVEKLAPKRSKLSVMKHLAEETERLGQSRSALEAWMVVEKYEPQGADRLEVSSRVARLRYNIGDKDGSLKSIQLAMKQWPQCNEKLDCDNLRKEIRNLITDWAKAETKKPSENLLGAFSAYVTTFDHDVEMMYFAAETAKAVKHYPEAVALYHKSSMLAHGSKDPKSVDILESSLTNEVEMAELAPKEQGYALRQSAYDFYISMSPNGKMNHKVRYQRARLPYEQGDNVEAVRRLEAFAKSMQCASADAEGHQLCIQAADLDLDARVLLKDDVSVEKGALSYARIYTEKKLEYLKIARQSALKQAATMEPHAAIAKLASINTEGMDRDESLRLLKTRMSLSEKVRDLPALRAAANQLLKTPKIDAKDHEYALSRLAYVAEMNFDFAQAYRIGQTMEMKELAPADRELKLAMFAELAGKNPVKHEEAFLHLSKNAAKRAVVRAKIVRAAPLRLRARELAANAGELKHFPSIYSPLVLEIFAVTNDRSFAERELQSRTLRAQPAGKVLARQLFLADFAKIDAKVSSHRIRSKGDAQMQRTLKERMSLLAEVEKAAAKAIKTGDWTSQAVTLAVLSRENNRMYADVMSLPVPKRLKGNDRLQYQQLVENQANTYLAKHRAIEAKLKGFWDDGKAFDQMVADFSTAKPELRRMMAREIKILARVAPGDRQTKLNKALSEGIDQASNAEIAVATRDARQSPFSASALTHLREVSESRDRDTMVAYLDARMGTLKEKQESKQ